MKPQKPLEAIIDSFAKRFGGELLNDLIDPQVRRADYLFRQHQVIAELKALEKDSFGQPFRRKMGELMADWQRRGLLMVFGRTLIDSHQLHPVCQEEMMNVIGKPFQDRILASANEQIRETKKSLGMPDAKGVLLLASDGNADLQPHTVVFLLKRLLHKKHENGAPQYSNIDGVVYFNPRMPVVSPESGQPTMFCLGQARRPEDQQMAAFLNAFEAAWFAYMPLVLGKPVRQRQGKPIPIETLQFAGVARELPHIQVEDPRRPKGG